MTVDLNKRAAVGMIKTKLIAKTVPVNPAFGADIGEFIAYVARVSNPGNQHNHHTHGKLLDFLEREKHFSPFEMANLVIEVEVTRDIARQLLRHRSFTFQEFSQRYALSGNFCEPKEARLQDHKNRQNSIEVDDEKLNQQWMNRQAKLIDFVKDHYDWAIENGIAKEVARVVLPEGLTMSRLYVNGTIRSWMHYVAVRTDPSTQKEHRELATQIAGIMRNELHGTNS